MGDAHSCGKCSLSWKVFIVMENGMCSLLWEMFTIVGDVLLSWKAFVVMENVHCHGSCRLIDHFVCHLVHHARPSGKLCFVTRLLYILIAYRSCHWWTVMKTIHIQAKLLNI